MSIRDCLSCFLAPNLSQRTRDLLHARVFEARWMTKTEEQKLRKQDAVIRTGAIFQQNFGTHLSAEEAKEAIVNPESTGKEQIHPLSLKT